MERNHKKPRKVDLKPGVYDAEIIIAEYATSKIKPDGSGGNPMLVLTFKVKDSFPNLWLVKNSEPYSLKNFANFKIALGMDPTHEIKFAKYERPVVGDPDVYSPELIGKKCKILCNWGKADNKGVCKIDVKRVLPVDYIEPTPVDPTQVSM